MASIPVVEARPLPDVVKLFKRNIMVARVGPRAYVPFNDQSNLKYNKIIIKSRWQVWFGMH